VTIQNEEVGGSGCTSRVGYFLCPSGFKMSMVGKDVFLKRKETRANLDGIEVGGGDNFN